MKNGNLTKFFNIAQNWRLLLNLIKDKTYKIPLIRKVAYTAMLLYIISPFDFIPLFPLDDLGIFTLFIGLVMYEIECYQEFKAKKEERRVVKKPVIAVVEENPKLITSSKKAEKKGK